MEKTCNIFGMLCFIISRKVKMQLKHTKKICAVCREAAVTDRTRRKWFAKFHAGGFSLDDAPLSWRPVEVDKNQTKTLIENNQCSTMWELANILKISKTIRLLVKMKMYLLFYRKN